ncbi:MAG TPA: hypothetical protein VGA64_09765, partial [Candidatus Polarisedimenticolia bacterium]
MPEGKGIDRDRLEREFLPEAEAIFESLAELMRELEARSATREGKPALLNGLFREVHSLKGLA